MNLFSLRISELKYKLQVSKIYFKDLFLHKVQNDYFQYDRKYNQEVDSLFILFIY